MNQQPKNSNTDNNQKGPQENDRTNTSNENENATYISTDREANPLYSDSIAPANEPGENISEEERDQRIKNEPDTARLRSERQSVIDGEKEKTEE